MGASYLRFGRGESLNSLSAKSEGIYPKTLFKKKYSIKPKQWKAIDDVHTPSEWHHTGKYANKTYFYNPAEVKMAWIEHYGYDTLPIGLKGIETFEIRRFKSNQMFMKRGNYSFKNSKNSHNNLAINFELLMLKGAFDKGTNLLNKLYKGSYITTNIETGELSMQISMGGNLRSKYIFYPSTNLGFNYFN